MKNQLLIVLGAFALAVLVLAAILPHGNSRVAPSQPASPGISKPLLPPLDYPLPDAEKVSLPQAQAKTSYTSPLPEAVEINQVWNSTNTESRSEQSVAIQFPTFARLVHDSQWTGYPSRTADPIWGGRPSTPETVPLWVAPQESSGKDNILLGPAWESYLRAINTQRGFDYIMVPAAGWFNQDDKADSLAFGGNIVRVEEVVNGYARVTAFHSQGSPPDPTLLNFKTAPWLVHKFTVVTRIGNIINAGSGLDVYIFLIGRGPLYVPVERLEFFPALPVTVTINPWASPWVNIREAPDTSSEVVAGLFPGRSATIYEYAPRGENVWGRTDQGWIALCWYPVARYIRYYTSWKLQTIPPVPPK
jgi:hypothetical protein